MGELLDSTQNSLKPAKMNKNHIDKHLLSVIHTYIYYNLLNSLYQI